MGIEVGKNQQNHALPEKFVHFLMFNDTLKSFPLPFSCWYNNSYRRGKTQQVTRFLVLPVHANENFIWRSSTLLLILVIIIMRHSQYLSPALLIYGIFFLAMWNLRDGSNSLDLTTTNTEIKTHGWLILISGRKQVYIEKTKFVMLDHSEVLLISNMTK